MKYFSPKRQHPGQGSPSASSFIRKGASKKLSGLLQHVPTSPRRVGRKAPHHAQTYSSDSSMLAPKSILKKSPAQHRRTVSDSEAQSPQRRVRWDPSVHFDSEDAEETDPIPDPSSSTPSSTVEPSTSKSSDHRGSPRSSALVIKRSNIRLKQQTPSEPLPQEDKPEDEEDEEDDSNHRFIKSLLDHDGDFFDSFPKEAEFRAPTPFRPSCEDDDDYYIFTDSQRTEEEDSRSRSPIPISSLSPSGSESFCSVEEDLVALIENTTEICDTESPVSTGWIIKPTSSPQPLRLSPPPTCCSPSMPPPPCSHRVSSPHFDEAPLMKPGKLKRRSGSSELSQRARPPSAPRVVTSELEMSEDDSDWEKSIPLSPDSADIRGLQSELEGGDYSSSKRSPRATKRVISASSPVSSRKHLSPLRMKESIMFGGKVLRLSEQIRASRADSSSSSSPPRSTTPPTMPPSTPSSIRSSRSVTVESVISVSSVSTATSTNSSASSPSRRTSKNRPAVGHRTYRSFSSNSTIVASHSPSPSSASSSTATTPSRLSSRDRRGVPPTLARTPKRRSPHSPPPSGLSLDGDDALIVRRSVSSSSVLSSAPSSPHGSVVRKRRSGRTNRPPPRTRPSASARRTLSSSNVSGELSDILHPKGASSAKTSMPIRRNTSDCVAV